MTENERINLLRKKYLNISLEKFGEHVGVTRSAMSNIENGSRGVTEQMRKSICREFHVREEWLRDGSGDPFAQKSDVEEIQQLADEVMADAPESFRRRFVTMLAKLSPEQWSVLSDVCDILLDESVPAESKDPDDTEDIEKKVADYRARLIEEKRAEEESSASKEA